ncbi:hypothetical protein GGU10DRAFT_154900 [Lentinula aff. detonsa]|uniref:Uncharacterized protein n=1 Tax=Lentinula aff. detonsa TaxID=2804958 RepID=A0AA38KQX4_9AGAR|nr:hypothetical protein GGU10DRAFT_154900 [Lentinula aff. detonsa]
MIGQARRTYLDCVFTISDEASIGEHNQVYLGVTNCATDNLYVFFFPPMFSFDFLVVLGVFFFPLPVPFFPCAMIFFLYTLCIRKRN